MNHLSRRTFIGGAAAASPPSPDWLRLQHSPDDDGDAPDLAGPVLARLRDARTGEITLYVGTDEISHTDRTLARRHR